jgi:hypothetical protein
MEELNDALALRAVLYLNEPRRKCFLNVNSSYVRRLLLAHFRAWEFQWTVQSAATGETAPLVNDLDLQFAEYEEINWDIVLSGETRCRASAYCVRKGMTRKAAWAQVAQKW